MIRQRFEYLPPWDRSPCCAPEPCAACAGTALLSCGLGRTTPARLSLLSAARLGAIRRTRLATWLGTIGWTRLAAAVLWRILGTTRLRASGRARLRVERGHDLRRVRSLSFFAEKRLRHRTTRAGFCADGVVRLGRCELRIASQQNCARQQGCDNTPNDNQVLLVPQAHQDIPH